MIHADYIPKRKIVPSLLFVGDRCGQAESAMEFYTSVFDDATINDVARYSPDQPPDEEGTVMFADFTLASQHFATMDSAQEHDFSFNDAISFIVDCEDQAEVDYFWEQLSADPDAEQCGWLKDKYGVSWQIVPTVLTDLLQDENTEKATRVSVAMLQMKKLDITTLEQAYAGDR